MAERRCYAAKRAIIDHLTRMRVDAALAVWMFEVFHKTMEFIPDPTSSCHGSPTPSAAMAAEASSLKANLQDAEASPLLPRPIELLTRFMDTHRLAGPGVVDEEPRNRQLPDAVPREWAASGRRAVLQAPQGALHETRALFRTEGDA